ncbi:hypothetical protein BPAE_0026g00340 [Botrytis paeoniae]|uniref:Uncharacterized protein n=1 Tax=Botrytis paeoniae TaxID=278948 RepID=A0A4Z1FUQ5_9HELO|nr:hypothetical protein BPAE_0026g00340 [Botrytis paeoniae]
MSSSTGVTGALSQKEKREQKRAWIRLQQRDQSIEISPACGGIYWTEPIERHTTTEGILIIIQFKLLQGFSAAPYDTGEQKQRKKKRSSAYSSSPTMRSNGPPNKLEVSMFKFDSGTFDSAGKKFLEGWIAWQSRWREEGVEASDLIPAAVEGQDKIFLFQTYDSAFGTKPIESLASLLQRVPPRHHKETLVTTEKYHDSKHIESVYSAAVGNCQYPAPRSTHMKMGSFHESIFLGPGREVSTRRLSIGNSILEILVGLQERMSKHVGLGYRKSKKREDAYYRQQNFTPSNGSSPPGRIRYENWGTHEGPWSVQFWIPLFFKSTQRRISNNGSHDMATERDWASLLRDDPPDPFSVPDTGSVTVKQAGRNIHYFFHEYPPPPPTSDTKTGNNQTPTRSYFTTITMWRSMDAMREWYTEYAANCDDYERLGHPLDQMRVFCENIRRVDSKGFDMVGGFYESIEPPPPASYSSSWPR